MSFRIPCNKSRLAVIALLALLSTPNISSFQTHAAALPTASNLLTNQNSSTSLDSPTTDSQSHIIRSIGFRGCSTESQESTNQIQLSNLALLYDGQSNTISLKADGSTDKEFDASSGKFSFQETFSAPEILPTKLPKQLFSFPAVEALASIQLYDSAGSSILCASVPLINTVSAQSPLISIASMSLTAATMALSALAGLVASFSSVALLSMPLTHSQAVAAATSLSPSVWDVVSFCQFIAMSGALNIEYPALLQQWTQNFGWSMGLVERESWNRAIDGLRARTMSGTNKGMNNDDNIGHDMTSTTIVSGSSESTTTTNETEKIVFNNNNSRNNGTTLPLNSTVTALSMHAMMDGAVKSLMQQTIYNNQNQTKDNVIVPVDAAKVLENAPYTASNVAAAVTRLLRRQVQPAAPIAPASPPATPPPPPPPAAPPVAAAPPQEPIPAPAQVPVTITPPSPPPPPPPSSPPTASGTPAVNPAGEAVLTTLINHLQNTIPSESAAALLPVALTPSGTPPLSWPEAYHPSTTPLRPPGLSSFGQRLNIPAKNMFMTALFLFLILLLVTSLVALVVRIGLEIYAYFSPGKFIKLRRRFSHYYAGSLLRVVLLAYFAVATMAFYQLTLKDAWPIMFLATMTILLFLGMATYITLRLRRAGGTSLFFDERLKSKYGALYDQYVLSAYLFFVPVLVYQMLKAAIVGLGHGGGSHDEDIENGGGHGSSSRGAWAQMSLLLLVEIVFTTLMIWKHPFADRVPNRLNAVLSCVRVLNVAMLAVLIEKSALSDVSRTVVGILITATQALMMVVLTCLVTYQLAKVLWKLVTVLNAKSDESKKNKLEGEQDPRHVDNDEEVLVISVEDMDEKCGFRKDKEDGYGEDGSAAVATAGGIDGGNAAGRMASEYNRGSESMTSLVGMMGIGQNPSMRYGSSDDDDGEEKALCLVGGGNNNDGTGYNGKDTDAIGPETIPQPQRQSRNSFSAGVTLSSHGNGGGKDGQDHVQDPRDSVQSCESQSSHILDYYNTAYLPSALRAKLASQVQKQREGPSINIVAPQEDDNNDDKHTIESEPMLSRTAERNRDSLVVPEVPGGLWVQAAYMTRRRSESNAQLAETTSRQDMTHGLHGQRPGTGNDLHDSNRRRPASVGSAAQSRLNRGTPPHNDNSMDGPPASRAWSLSDRRTSLGSGRLDLFPAVTFIPTSLLDGPPPPLSNTESRRGSVSTAMLATPPPTFPVLPPQAAMDRMFMTTTTTPSLSTDTTPATSPTDASSRAAPPSAIPSFNTYRFPDERQTSDELTTPIERTIAAAQRHIHPLSPFHPDYQHPDDRYNPSLPSPNECHPPPPLPQPLTSERQGSLTGYTNPNTIQMNDARSTRPSSTVTTTTMNSGQKRTGFYRNSHGLDRQKTPSLTIVTTPHHHHRIGGVSVPPPPQMPLPAVLPPTPFSSREGEQPRLGVVEVPVTEEKKNDTGKQVISVSSQSSQQQPVQQQQQQQQQLTPDSAGPDDSHNKMSTSSITLNGPQVMTKTVDLVQMTRSASNESLLSNNTRHQSSARSSPSPHRQRALSITPLPLTNKPAMSSKKSQ
ncbi:hypothetical protein BGZ94_007439 [Podila epigama]|nr:hypothetical protein BGZ94_007439 [Podila epigama]